MQDAKAHVHAKKNGNRPLIILGYEATQKRLQDSGTDEGYTFRSSVLSTHSYCEDNEFQCLSRQTTSFADYNCYNLCVTSGNFSCEFGLSGLITRFAKWYFSSFHYFFLRVFSSLSRTFHSFWDVIITAEGLQFWLILCSHDHWKARGFKRAKPTVTRESIYDDRLREPMTLKPESLVYPGLDSKTQPSACEVNAAVILNQWILVWVAFL